MFKNRKYIVSISTSNTIEFSSVNKGGPITAKQGGSKYYTIQNAMSSISNNTRKIRICLRLKL